jgi:hypothetical protein
MPKAYQIKEIEKWVWFYYKQGFSIIPLKAKSKKPNISTWDEYKSRTPTEKKIKDWVKKGLFENLGVICGAISNNLLVIDFDDPTILNDTGLTIERAQKLGWLQKTGREGRYQLWLRNKDDPGDTVKDALINLERRGNGAYVVATPSIHPNGKQYYFLNAKEPRDLKPLPIVEGDQIWEECKKNAYEKRNIKTTVAEKPPKMGGYNT